MYPANSVTPSMSSLSVPVPSQVSMTRSMFATIPEAHGTSVVTWSVVSKPHPMPYSAQNATELNRSTAPSTLSAESTADAAVESHADA